MASTYGSLLFTSAVKTLQEAHGSRRLYDTCGTTQDRLSDSEIEFIAERDSLYVATIGSSGWPYVQHRGGPKGFLQTIDDKTLAFADFRGNKQYISAGNLATDDRVSIIMVDYPNQARLKLLGHAQVFEDDKEWIERIRVPAYKAVVERVIVVHLAAFDWNCPQHITPRYTAEEIRIALEPTIARVDELEQENRKLRAGR